MSELASLLGKPKTFKIGNLELEFEPRTLEDIDLAMDLAIDEKRGEAMKELIKRTLKDAVKDATDEEIKSIALRHLKTLSEAIIEVNGLSQDAKNE